MRKTDKPTPPKPPRTSGSGPVASRTPSKTPTGRRPTKPVVKVQPKGALKKSAVRNPSAPKPAGSGTSITLLNKAESTMKRDKAAGRNRSGQSMNKSKSPNKSMAGSRGNQRLIDQTQYLKFKGYTELKPGEKAAANTKGGKPSKVTPKKSAPAPKPKSGLKGRISRIGRGGGMGAGGGGGLYGSMFKR